MKLDVLMCIGEQFLQCGEACLKHLSRSMDVILLSCQGVVHLRDHNYAEVLQETIIETLMCVFHGLNNEQPCQALANYTQLVIEFIVFTTEKVRHPKLDYVRDTLVLLADVVSFYPNQTKSFLSPQVVQARLDTLNKYNRDGHLTANITYISRQLRL